jgi:transcriptional regulator with XRE-family HTH domain
MARAQRHPHQAFGERVRSFRSRLDLTQEQLGAIAGLHRTYIGGVERGERNVSLNNILRLARALDVDPSELVTTLPDPS